MKTRWPGSIASTVPRSNVAKWPDIGATTRSFGPGSAGSRGKPRSNAITRQNGRCHTTRSVTGTATPSTRVSARPKAGLP